MRQKFKTISILVPILCGFFSANLPAQQPHSDPGRVTARRLNRYEYDSTIRDLLAVDFHPAADFPADDAGYGFDNIADVLSLSPVLMDKYLAAAEKIAALAIQSGGLPKPGFERHSRSDNLRAAKDPGLQIERRFPAEGDYDFLIGIRGKPDPGLVKVSLDGRLLDTVDIRIFLDDRRTAELRVHAPFGKHVVSMDLLPQTAPASAAPPPETKDKDGHPPPKPGISYLEVRGPYNPIAPPPAESYLRVFPCGHAPGQHTIECVRRDLAQLARRAYRRPVKEPEVDGLMRLVESDRERGDTLEQAMGVALEAILVSPRFLFRIELDPNPSDPAAHNLSAFELASRLSYFLWSSMPDEPLFQAAASGETRKPEILDAQLHRMLSDPKARALVENFAGQWLETRNLDQIRPDPERFPMFDDDLRRDMKQETALFVGSIIHEDRSIVDFIKARYTFLNERLAKLYEIPGIEGNEFRRVDLGPESHRGGILTEASVLTVSSYPSRTSPVLRGKWILENILNAPPPPPPPDVPNLDEKAIGATGTLRQQLEGHRTNPVCRACHARMDPLGFGLENYDAIGRWRTHDGKFPIDASGTLPKGESFDGPAGLESILLRDKNAFAECLAEKLLTYAIGRGPELYDRDTIQLIVRRTAADNYRFSSLVRAIVSSPAFQMRRGEGQVTAAR